MDTSPLNLPPEEEGDIGYAISPARSPPLRGLRSREFTPSSSPSPSSSRQRHSQSRDAVPSSSRPASTSRSSSSNRFPASHPAHLSPPSPPPRFVPYKSPLPINTMSLNGLESPTDISAPFESIPLQPSPPLHPETAPLPSPPGHFKRESQGKRSSWSGFGKVKDGQHNANGSTPNLNGGEGRRLAEISRAHSQEGFDHSTGSGSGRTTPNRLHAPPARPHPYPLPSTSSPPVPNNRLRSTASPAPASALGVKGRSTFENVISHTRPSWLPPKDKVEDETHLHQWEEMMAQARATEVERQKVNEARRLDKERRMAIRTPRWEALLNSPDFSVGKVKKDMGLKRLWFEGVPTHLRGKAWSLAIGNPLALSKDAYKAYSARARRAIEAGRFPPDVLERIERELDDTLPTLKLFTPGSPLRDDLRELLCAWVVCRSDESLGYAPCVNLVAAMLLLTSPLPNAFLSLVNLLSRPCLNAFFNQITDEIEAYFRVFENLQADTFPKIYANCKNLGLRIPESYFRSLLVEQVPFEACCRLWDQIMLDGDQFIFRAALAIFGFLETRLHYPDHEEIISILEGRNRATLAITERERERARLRNEPFLQGLDGKLSVFGLNEAALFDWLESDGWQESRFDRLVQREMPD